MSFISLQISFHFKSNHRFLMIEIDITPKEAIVVQVELTPINLGSIVFFLPVLVENI